MKMLELVVVVLLLVVTAVSTGPVDTGEPAAPATVAIIDQATAEATIASTARPSATLTSTLAPTKTAWPTATASLSPTDVASPVPSIEQSFSFDTRSDLERYLYVDQMSQYLYVFERGNLVRAMPCSTGLPSDTTYTEAWEGAVGRYYGTFTSFGVWADEAWYLYPSLGNILVHSLPYVWQNGYKVYLERDALGERPASHGCIRLAPEDAAWLTAYNPEGVLMTITEPYRAHWRAVLGETLDLAE